MDKEIHKQLKQKYSNLNPNISSRDDKHITVGLYSKNGKIDCTRFNLTSREGDIDSFKVYYSLVASLEEMPSLLSKLEDFPINIKWDIPIFHENGDVSGIYRFDVCRNSIQIFSTINTAVRELQDAFKLQDKDFDFEIKKIKSYTTNTMKIKDK